MKTSAAQRSTKDHKSIIWNVFDANIRNCNSIKLFKVKLKKSLLYVFHNLYKCFSQNHKFAVSETLCLVGIKDRRISDSAMTASSTHPGGYDAFYGRLDNTGQPRGFWHPAGKKTNSIYYMQF